MENQMKDNAGSPGVESLVKRGCLFLEDSEWNKADEYFDKALDVNPEHAPAYIGKLCAELMVRLEESLGDYNELRQGKKFDRPLGEYGNFQKALRFADGDYLKKLNGFDQKIKESFPKIPQRFTDEFVKSEIAKLKKEIADCDAEIAKAEKDAGFWQGRNREASSRKQKMIDQHNSIMSAYNDRPGLGGIERLANFAVQRESRELLENSDSYKSYEEEISDSYEKMNDAYQHVRDYKSKKAEYEAKKQEFESLADISCLDRMDIYYNRLVKAMKKESTEDGYKNIAEQFRLLEGYKDSAELADKCGKLAIKALYNKLVQEKDKATTEEKYRELSKQFRKMGSYENSAQLAEECDKLADECVKKKESEKKERYDNLVKEKTNTSSEDKYRQLTQKFREMGNYENAVQLADECDKQMNILKKQREERERQEQARIAAREAEEQAEREEQKRRKKRAKNIRGLMFTFVPFIVGIVLYFIAYNSEINLPLIGGLIFLGVPLVIIHLRDYWGFLSVSSIIVFWIVIFSLTSSINLGSFAMVAAFIMAIAYPKEKYWD